MNEQILIAAVGFAGVVIGSVISLIVVFIQEVKNHKRWLIDKRITFIENQLLEIEESKNTVLKDLHNIFNGKKFDDNDKFVFSVPFEIISIIKKVFEKYKNSPDSKIWVKELSDAKKQEIFIDVASALESKKIELKSEIKKLLS